MNKKQFLEKTPFVVAVDSSCAWSQRSDGKMPDFLKSGYLKRYPGRLHTQMTYENEIFTSVQMFIYSILFATDGKSQSFKSWGLPYLKRQCNAGCC